jgi:hypothetical protein
VVALDRLVEVWMKLSAVGLIVTGLVGGSILIDEWQRAVPGDGHSDTTETREGPPLTITVTNPTDQCQRRYSVGSAFALIRRARLGTDVIDFGHFDPKIPMTRQYNRHSSFIFLC